jgi:hypothetical protein
MPTGLAMSENELPRFTWARHESLLSEEDVAILTGRALKSRQIEALTTMGVPFAVNIIGHPLVPRSAVDGSAARGRREAKELQKELDDGLRRLLEDNARAARSRRK